MEGIRKRHSRRCGSLGGAAECDCQPSYEAAVFSARGRRKLGRSFPTYSAARAWRIEALRAVSRAALRAPTRITLLEAADARFVGRRAGAARTRAGVAIKPSVIRGYEQALRTNVLPKLGG